jgi:hypothetical protein
MLFYHWLKRHATHAILIGNTGKADELIIGSEKYTIFVRE